MISGKYAKFCMNLVTSKIEGEAVPKSISYLAIENFGRL